MVPFLRTVWQHDNNFQRLYLLVLPLMLVLAAPLIVSVVREYARLRRHNVLPEEAQYRLAVYRLISAVSQVLVTLVALVIVAFGDFLPKVALTGIYVVFVLAFVAPFVAQRLLGIHQVMSNPQPLEGLGWRTIGFLAYGFLLLLLPFVALMSIALLNTGHPISGAVVLSVAVLGFIISLRQIIRNVGTTRQAR